MSISLLEADIPLLFDETLKIGLYITLHSRLYKVMICHINLASQGSPHILDRSRLVWYTRQEKPL